MAPPSKKRKTNSTAPAEIKFDFSAREEYLTGFHKRKQARIKHAQEQAAKQEKEERLRLRKQVSTFYNFTLRSLQVLGLDVRFF
jgi:ribosomal RNA-processing protein 17